MLNEVFEYPFTRLDPVSGDHLDPPSAAVYETLLTKGPDGQPAPGLATAWTVGEGGSEWRLRIRAGAKFHSGAICDAVTVVQALEQCRWGEGFSRQIWYWDPVDKVRAEGDDVVRFLLKYPCSRLPVLLWGGHTAIANPAARSRDLDRYGVTEIDGTGPFRVEEFSEDSIVVRRSSHWNGAGSEVGLPAAIRWVAAPKEAQRKGLLHDRGIDVVRAVQPSWIDQQDQAEWSYVDQPENSQFYLALNFEDPRGFGDVNFRRAVEAFIDRHELVERGLAGLGHARRSPLPVADEFASSYDAERFPALSIEVADRMLDDLDYRRNQRGIREYGGRELLVDCVVQDVEVFRRIAGTLAAQLARAGIILLPRFVAVFEDFYRACEESPSAFISKWLWGDGMEAIMGFSRTDCAADSGGNWQHARNFQLDRAYDRFLQADTAEALDHAGAVVQATFMQELPYIPLCSPMESYAVRSRVKGFAPVPRTLYPEYVGVERASGAGDR